MNCKRIFKHLLTPAWRIRSALPAQALRSIEAAIRNNETTHSGQIRFAVEAALDLSPILRNVTARERALDIFSDLRVWDTEHNNGVLIYLLLADHDVEIVADRGIHAQVGADEWERICRAMETHFRAHRFEQGVLEGIHAISVHLARHFPGGEHRNELPDKPVLL